MYIFAPHARQSNRRVRHIVAMNSRLSTGAIDCLAHIAYSFRNADAQRIRGPGLTLAHHALLLVHDDGASSRATTIDANDQPLGALCTWNYGGQRFTDV